MFDKRLMAMCPESKVYMPGTRNSRSGTSDTADNTFFLVTAYCFARSSEKLNNWFKGTKLYKKHLDSTPDLLLAFCEDD